jgi:hypothetical protein
LTVGDPFSGLTEVGWPSNQMYLRTGISQLTLFVQDLKHLVRRSFLDDVNDISQSLLIFQKDYLASGFYGASNGMRLVDNFDLTQFEDYSTSI